MCEIAHEVWLHLTHFIIHFSDVWHTLWFVYYYFLSQTMSKLLTVGDARYLLIDMSAHFTSIACSRILTPISIWLAQKGRPYELKTILARLVWLVHTTGHLNCTHWLVRRALCSLSDSRKKDGATAMHLAAGKGRK